MARPDSPAVVDRKRQMVTDRLARLETPSANSAQLAASFGLSVDEVRRLMRNAGVRDRG